MHHRPVRPGPHPCGTGRGGCTEVVEVGELGEALLFGGAGELGGGHFGFLSARPALALTGMCRLMPLARA